MTVYNPGTGGGGGGTTAATDTIYDAKGDIVAASAADTGARVAVGADGTTLTADAASAAGVKWDTPVRNLVDAKGDVLAGTADNVLARVAVGSNGRMLVADSAQTPGLKWGNWLQHVRISLGAFSASQTIDVTLTWPVTFGDTSYTLTVAIVETGGPTANNSAMRQVLTKTATGGTVRIAAGTVGYSAGALELHAIGIHD